VRRFLILDIDLPQYGLIAALDRTSLSIRGPVDGGMQSTTVSKYSRITTTCRVLESNLMQILCISCCRTHKGVFPSSVPVLKCRTNTSQFSKRFKNEKIPSVTYSVFQVSIDIKILQINIYIVLLIEDATN
jgi:hypothetical protein